MWRKFEPSISAQRVEDAAVRGLDVGGVTLGDGRWINYRTIVCANCRWVSGRCKRRWTRGNRQMEFAVPEQTKQQKQGGSNRFKKQHFAHRRPKTFGVGCFVARSIAVSLHKSIFGCAIDSNARKQ